MTVESAARPVLGHPIEALYAHVPFCRHKCHYCDFYSVVDLEGRQGRFVARFEEDVEASRPWLTHPLQTVFVGGGTPTLLAPPLLARVCASIASLPSTPGREWTVEANPETVDREVAAVLVAHGVNRVSLGAQSFDPALLHTLERQHDPASVARAVGLLRAGGIEDINIDLIFGIPGSSVETWERDLREVLALAPTHVSCYALTYEPGTALEARLRQGRIVRVDEELECAQLECAQRMLGGAGFDHYEISNWALPGRHCRHNRVYWEMGSWWGLGPSASAQVGRHRWKVQPRLGDWLSGPPLGTAVDTEVSGDDQWVGECFMMGLRLREGMPEARVDGLLSMGTRGPSRRSILERGFGRGWLERTDGAMRLTGRGMLVANELVGELIRADNG